MKDTIPQTFLASSNALIGVPYCEADCWQLAVRFYSLVFQVDLKHYYDETPRDRADRRCLIYSNRGEFELVDSPEFGDLILISILGIESHIGIFLGGDTFLHTKEATGSVIDRVSRYRTRITGYYRLKRDAK